MKLEDSLINFLIKGGIAQSERGFVKSVSDVFWRLYTFKVASRNGKIRQLSRREVDYHTILLVMTRSPIYIISNKESSESELLELGIPSSRVATILAARSDPRNVLSARLYTFFKKIKQSSNEKCHQPYARDSQVIVHSEEKSLDTIHAILTQDIQLPVRMIFYKTTESELTSYQPKELEHTNELN